MNRVISIDVLVVLIIALLLPQHLLASEKGIPAPEQHLKTIIVDNYYPYTFVNRNGLPDGFSVDIIRAVTSVMGMAIDIEVGPWDKAAQALKAGQIDLLPMMAYSQERDRYYDFSPPHTIAYDAIFIRKGSPKIKSIEELHGKTIIVMNRDAAHDYLRSIGIDDAKLILVNSLPEALRLLSSGKGEAGLMPKLVGLVNIKNLGLTNLEPSPVPINAYSRPFSLAVKEGNQALLERLSQGLSIIKVSGQYHAIYTKWFGAIEPTGVSIKTVLKYSAIIVAFFAIIGSALLFWNFSLKKQVALRTKNLELEIATRKEAIEALSESETKFRLVFESANVGKSITLPTGEITVNKAFCDMLGYTGEALKNRRWQELTPPDEIDSIQKQLDPLLQGKADAVRFTKRYIHKNGSHIWADVSVVIHCDNQGNPLFFITTLFDITDSKKAHELLFASEEKFRKIFYSAPILLTISDIVSGQYIEVNNAFLEASGFSRDEVIGKTSVSLGWISADDRERLVATLLTHGSIVEMELSLTSKDGSPVHCLYRGEIITIGGIEHLLSIMLDVTGRKKFEDALKSSLREKEILLKEIQHRVKNNLITISSILTIQMNQTKDDESKSALITCMNRINAMSRIHRKLYQSQDYSRINIREYFTELVQELSRSYGFSNEDITVDISDIPIDVNTAIPLGLLVNELITNIMKHAFKDGRRGKIEITMTPMDSHFMLTVSDNGIGIPPHIDIENTESVGLLLVNQLVNQIDGSIQFINENGTKIIITFPTDQEQAP